MKEFEFLITHGYKKILGIINAQDKAEAREKILEGKYDDIIDEYNMNDLTVGYEIIELEEI